MQRRVFNAVASAFVGAPLLAQAETNGMPDMRMIRGGEVRLATQAFGAPSDAAVLLIMGATASMLGWPDAFCHALAGEGLYVIRYDHRDTGRSTTLPLGAADYAVEDLAADALAVLDGYGLADAHVVGMSLGGYLAQMLAVAHPGRIRSLALTASEPLGWDGAALPHIDPVFLEHFAGLGSLDWSDGEAVAAFLLEIERLCAGPGAAFDAEAAAIRVQDVLARTESPASMFNHATLATRDDWQGAYRAIRRPTLVIHGALDPVLPVANGRALAERIPGATLAVMEGVGHALPAGWTDRLSGLIARHARDADG